MATTQIPCDKSDCRYRGLTLPEHPVGHFPVWLWEYAERLRATGDTR